MELTKLESELIVHEIILTLRSIQYNNSIEKKGEFCFKKYDKYDLSDFDLHEAELTENEFKDYMSILTKIKSLSTQSLKKSQQDLGEKIFNKVKKVHSRK